MGLTAGIAPSGGGQATGGAEALWNTQMVYGVGSHPIHGAGEHVNAEIGNELPVSARLVGAPKVGYSASLYGRDYRTGYSLELLDSDAAARTRGGPAAAREPPDGRREQGRARLGHHRLVAGARDDAEAGCPC